MVLIMFFLGLETGDEDIALTLHKNISKNSSRANLIPTSQPVGWMEKFDDALTFFDSCNINTGVSILFGLGETQVNRVRMLSTLLDWQMKYDSAKCVSLNWAVRHPLRNDDVKHKYLDWAVDPRDDRYPLIISLFGEASTCYGDHEMPSLEELQEIKKYYLRLNNII